MTKEELISRIYQRLPIKNSIKIKDISKSESAIYFSWNRRLFKVSMDMFVEELEGFGLYGSDSATLIETLLKIE